jgi:hypothetical protein
MAGLQKESVYWRVFTHSYDPYADPMTPTVAHYENVRPLGRGIRLLSEALEIAADDWQLHAPEGKPLLWHQVFDTPLIAALTPTGIIYQVEHDHQLGFTDIEWLRMVVSRTYNTSGPPHPVSP